MSGPTLPWLTDAEIDDLCEGLTQKSAMVRYLKDELNLPVKTKPNGRPLVPRWACEEMLAIPPGERPNTVVPAGERTQPDERALLSAISRS